MTDHISIYREDDKLLFTSRDNALPAPPDLITNYYLDLYVDTGEPELISYTKVTTTLEPGGRPENVFFRYRPETRHEMFREFQSIFHANEPTGGPSSNITEDEIPDDIITSGLFEDTWEYSKRKWPQSPYLIAEMDPGTPGLDRLEREAVEKIFGQDNSLQFGVSSLASAVQITKWVVKKGINCRIAVGDKATNSSISADFLLEPGYDSEFLPLDATTESAFESAIASIRDDWQTELNERSEELVDNLIKNAATNADAYTDLDGIHNYIQFNRDHEFSTDTGHKIQNHYDDIRNDDHLTGAEKTELINHLKERIKEERGDVEEKCISSRVDDLRDAIESTPDSVRRGQSDINELISNRVKCQNIKNLISKDSGQNSISNNSFQKRWNQCQHDLPDALMDRVREKLDEGLRKKINEFDSSIKNKIEERIENECERIRDESSSLRGRIEKLNESCEAFDNHSKDALHQDNINQYMQLCRVLNENPQAEEFRETAKRQLSDNLETEYERYIEHKINEARKDCTSLSQRHEFIEEISPPESTGNVSINSENARDAGEMIEEVNDSNYLFGEDKEDFREKVTDINKEKTDSIKEEYEERFLSILDKIEKNHTAETKMNIYDDIRSIIDKQKSFQGVFSDSRDFEKLWDEVEESDVISDEWLSKKRDKLSSKIKKEREECEKVLKPGHQGQNRRDSRDRTPPANHKLSQDSGRIDLENQRYKFLLAVVTVLVIVGIPIFLIAGPPDILGSDAPQPEGNPADPGQSGAVTPPVELDSPSAASMVDGNTILVSGNATADQVDLNFASTSSSFDRSYSVEPENQQFEKEFDDIPVGTYRLVATPNETRQTKSNENGMILPVGSSKENSTNSTNGETGTEDTDVSGNEAIAAPDARSVVFTYLGEDPSVQIEDTDFDNNTLVVNTSLSPTLGNATVRIYDEDGQQVGSSSRGIDNEDYSQGTDVGFKIDVNNDGIYIIELSPTHTSGTELLERQIHNGSASDGQ